MAIAMVAMLAFGGTYAYFTATAGDATKDLTMGIIALGDSEVSIATTVKDVLPGEEIEEITFSVTDKSNRASFIFVEVSGVITPSDDKENVDDLEVEITLTEGTVLKSGTTEGGKTFYYVTTEDYSDNTTQGQEIEFTTELTLSLDIGNDYQAGTLTITLSTKSIQQEGYADVVDAYAALNA